LRRFAIAYSVITTLTRAAPVCPNRRFAGQPDMIRTNLHTSNRIRNRDLSFRVTTFRSLDLPVGTAALQSGVDRLSYAAGPGF